MIESIISFVEQQWMYLLIALVVILIMIKIFKRVIRWLIVLVIIGTVIVAVIYYNDGILIHSGQKIAEQAVEYTTEQAVNGLLSEVKDANYTLKADGTYEVQTSNFSLRGRVGKREAVIVFKGQEIPIELGEPLFQFIEQAKANGK